ncbi:AAA family ATPase [Schumannella soli]|uniref:AAA family ATPase n=1 Tax=Schumannella soli TaxID=2590779 RepID=A0A506YC47_9MICO|nr:AAA family ATPase [Schumannella soli]TPW77999.1 AAA family ATPase [Schumannella soli]
MKITVLGGWRIEHAGAAVAVSGAMQLALLFRLAADAGTAVSYRALAEDLWPIDTPENPRGALQSIVSRLRTQLPAASIESTTGGYRLALARADVDALVFQDLVAAAVATPDPADTVRLASAALALWRGEPWLPSPDFDWFARDLLADRTTALELGGRMPGAIPAEVDAARESGSSVTAAAPTAPVAQTASSRPADQPEPLPPSSDAPAATPPAHPFPLIPVPLTPLVGRAAELVNVAAQLDANRLVTILGPGGAGKTRLAIEAARARVAATGEPALVVELASVAAAEIWSAVLAATGRELRNAENQPDTTPPRERARQALAGRRALLVLDNTEHLLDAAAEVAITLLSALPELRILATSREPLGAPGEAFVSLGPLAHPDAARLDGGLASDAERLRAFPAIDLFRQRARAARGVDLDDAELAVAARICLHLDGLPLALELAAAKLRTLTVDEVLVGLEDRFALLAGPGRGTLPRHQTLRAAIDWSWSLLDESERTALSVLAVFPAGLAVVDARAVSSTRAASPTSTASAVGSATDAGAPVSAAPAPPAPATSAAAPTAAPASPIAALGIPDPAVFDALVDKSLVQRARGRFRTLETIREYGLAHLIDAGREREARDAQAVFALGAAAAHDVLLRGPRILETIAWFDAEHDNLIGALRHLVATEQADAAVELLGACSWYWMMRDRNAEAAEWMTSVAPLAARVEGELATVVAAAGRVIEVFLRLGPTEEPDVIAALLGALGPSAELRPHAGQAPVVQVVASFILMLSRIEPGSDWRTELRGVDGAELGLDPWPTALLLVVDASLAHNRGDVEQLGRVTERALGMLSEIGDLWSIAVAQQMRAEWLALVGRLDEALEVTDASTENLRRITSEADLAQQQDLAVRILARQGKPDAARARAEQVLDETLSSGVRRAITQAAASATIAAAQQGDAVAAAAFAAHLDESDETLAPFAQLAAAKSVARTHLALLQGDVAAADEQARDALRSALDSHDLPVIAQTAVAVARVCLARGDAELAARLLLAADAARGIPDELDPWVREVRAGLRERGIAPPGDVAGDLRAAAARELTRLPELLAP